MTNEKIIKILEKNGFKIETEGLTDGYELRQYTPAGEDWFFSLVKLEDIIKYASDFDSDEEFEFWVKAECQGKPSISELYKIQKWKKNILSKVSKQIIKL